jgi:hypothetical protein
MSHTPEQPKSNTAKALIGIGDEWANRINNWGKAIGLVGLACGAVWYAGGWVAGHVAKSPELVASIAVLAMPFFMSQRLTKTMLAWSKSAQPMDDLKSVLESSYNTLLTYLFLFVFAIGHTAYKIAGTREESFGALVDALGVGWWGCFRCIFANT